MSQDSTTAAGKKSAGAGAASRRSFGNGSHGTDSGVLTLVPVSGVVGHSGGGGAVVQKIRLGAEELATKAGVGNGAHHLKLLTLAAATMQSASQPWCDPQSLLSTHGLAGDMLCTHDAHSV